MDEKEWLACTEIEPMVEFLRGRTSDRKARLFAVACCRRLKEKLPVEECWQALEAAEMWADGLLSREALRAKRVAVEEAKRKLKGNDSYAARAVIEAAKPRKDAAVVAAYGAATATGGMPYDSEAILFEKDNQCGLLRDIFGNPFRPATVNPAWQTPTVLTLATAAYDNRLLPAGHLDPDHLAVLADALEESGCTNADILSHLRQPGSHFRGCWLVDLILGKE